jgi:hypothetical protein
MSEPAKQSARETFSVSQPTAWPRWLKVLLSLAFVGAVGALAWSRIPDGAYPTDLSRIGVDRPAAVLAFDANYTGGMEVMEMMNAVRGEFATKIEFLVANQGDDDGRRFAELHAIGDGGVVVFAADGTKRATLARPASQEELRSALSEALRP